MMSFKTFVICSVIAYAQATKPDALSKRDSSVEVDPYAAYYEAYSQNIQPLTQGLITEKQGFAGVMQNVLGDDAALIIGFIGVMIGGLAAIGVVLNDNNIIDLSKDQDSICTTVKDLGGFTAIALSVDSDFTDKAPTQAELVAAFNKVENAINALSQYPTPDC